MMTHDAMVLALHDSMTRLHASSPSRTLMLIAALPHYCQIVNCDALLHRFYIAARRQGTTGSPAMNARGTSQSVTSRLACHTLHLSLVTCTCQLVDLSPCHC